MSICRLPGDIRPARLRIELHDLVWEGMYLPLAGAVGYAADRLNHLQFLTIRRYLSLVFYHPRHAAAGARDMVVISDILVQGIQMVLVLLLAPLLTGFCTQDQGSAGSSQGSFDFSAVSGSLAAAPEKKRCWPTMRRGCSG